MSYRLPFLFDYVFGNIVLPNALSSEYGIVNYLHTLYSNKIKNNSFFEEEFGYHDQTIGGLLFDNQLGTHPTSVGNLNILAHCYRDYLTCIEDSVYFGKKKFGKYIYPIRINPYISDFIGYGSKGQKINGEYFWKNMSAESLRDAQDGNALIFLDFGQENYLEKDVVDQFHYSLSRSGISPSQIIFAINSFNAKEIYDRWYPLEEQLFEMHDWPFVLANVSYHYNIFVEQRISIDNFYRLRNTIRKNHFLFKIRRPRDHRLAILFKLASDGLLSKGDWSCLSPVQSNDNVIEEFAKQCDMSFDLPKVNQVIASFPKTLESESGNNYTAVRAWTDQHPKSYMNSYFYICTETFLHGDFKSLTEKAFKPIVNFMPFVIIAYPGALKLLQSLGFKTFSPWIDESYDNELDSVKRIKLVYEQITKICHMPIEQLHEWYWQMEDIYVHNYNHFLEYYKHDVKGKELIKYLYNRIVT